MGRVQFARYHSALVWRRPSRTLAHVAGSPFLDARSPFTPYECAKMVVMAPLALMRWVAILCLINVANGVAWLALQFRDTAPFDAALVGIARLMAVAATLSVDTVGLQHLRQAERCVLVFNHVSVCDFLVLLRFGVFAFVTRDSFSRIPMTRYLNEYVRCVFLRSGEIGAATAIAARIRREDAPRLAIAPEGTLSNGSCLLRFKTGAFVARAPVLPVVLSYPFRHHNPAWTVETHVAFKLLRILSQLVTPVRVEFLPLMHPLDDETVPEFAQRVRCVMAAALAVPLVELDESDRQRVEAHARI